MKNMNIFELELFFNNQDYFFWTSKYK